MFNRNTVLNQSAHIFALGFGSKKKGKHSFGAEVPKSTAFTSKSDRNINLVEGPEYKVSTSNFINFIANIFDYLNIKIDHVDKMLSCGKRCYLVQCT